MAVNMGSAIARGLVKGLGEGYSKHLEDQRRERLDDKRLADSFNMFKKQSQYSFGLQNISKQNELLGKWEDAAKLSTGDLAYQVATKMSQPFSKEDRPKFFRDAMKNLNGMTKAELLSRAGYNKPDYSNYINNPDYQDAIPRARIAGMADMPDMEQTFKYDPRQYADVQKANAEKVTDYMRKKQDEYKSINTLGVMKFGKTLSDEVKNFIWKNRPEGTSVSMKGAEAISYDENLLTSLVNNGQVVPVGNTLKFVGELTDDEKGLFGVQGEGQEQPMEQPKAETQPLYTEPKTEQYLAEKEEKAETKRVRQVTRDIEKKSGKTIKSYRDLEALGRELENLDEGTKAALFGALSTEGLLGATDFGRKLAAKFGNESAQKARAFLSRMTNVSAALKHEQYGSAQTKTELETFADQLGDPSLLQNPETLLEQIQTRLDLIGNDLDSSIGMEGREAYLAQHPELAESSLGKRWGPKEEGGENGQVSDSAKPHIKDAQGQDVTKSIPAQFWSASPEKQQQFLKQYNLTIGG